jgi:ubiquinone/menaquinone biosynthesis C-methylase UbiE
VPSYVEIYERHADRYDELVRREDKDGNLPRALATTLGDAAKDGVVVEIGAGTGRVTRLLAPLASSVRAYDGSAHMIELARERLASLANVRFGVADNASLPEPSAVADAVVAGWTIGHVTGFFPDAWEPAARAALAEMKRVAKPGAARSSVTSASSARPSRPTTRSRRSTTPSASWGSSSAKPWRKKSAAEARRSSPNGRVCGWYGPRLPDLPKKIKKTTGGYPDCNH